MTDINYKKNSYYNQNKLECFDAIEGMLGREGLENFCRANVLKYIWRYKDKNGKQDLLKAKAYLEKLIDLMDQ